MSNQSLSIAMCTYNGAKYLKEQLDSIIRQTRIPEEMIVCDDGSIDHTMEILETFKKTAPFRVKIYRNKKNLGPTKNFEKAIRLCNGDIIALSDQDDVWMPQKLEKLEKALDTYPKAGYVFSDALVVDKNLHPLGYTIWDRMSFKPFQRRRFEQGNQLEILLKRNVVTGATMAFRSKLRETILPIPSQWMHDTWIPLLLSASKEKGIFVDEPLIKYRQHPKQVIGGKKSSLRDKYRRVCNLAKENYIKEIKKLENLCEILRKKDKLNINAKELIHLKIYHLQNRSKLYDDINIFRKLKIMFFELVSGRYHRFSKGLESLIKDLIFT